MLGCALWFTSQTHGRVLSFDAWSTTAAVLSSMGQESEELSAALRLSQTIKPRIDVLIIPGSHLLFAFF